MKKSIKTILLCLSVLMLLSAFALSASAVPSYFSGKSNGNCKSHTNKLVTLDDIADHTPEEIGGLRKIQKAEITKNIPLVIIVIGFDNIGYNEGYNWGNTIFNSSESLMQYYTDMSFGQFTFVPARESYESGTYDKKNDGVIHVTVDQKHDDWSLMQTDPILYWNNTYTMTKAFIAAINKANAYINFAQYDDNKNGVIENNEMALGFVVAGYEAAYQTSFNTYSFWSHAFSISESIESLDSYPLLSSNLKVPVCDGVKVDSYIGIAEKLDTKTQEPICVLAHELGHYLGLPDLYDTVYSTGLEWSDYSVDALSVMCSGMWCYDEENEKFIPASFDAWSRYELGWITPTKVTQNGTYELTSQDYSNPTEQIKTVLIPTQNTNEYYIAENRQFTGWDRFLGNSYNDDNGGVVIWHIDKNIYNQKYDTNQVNNCDHRPSVMPLYPEEKNSVLTFTGNGNVLYNPFFTSSNWAEDYAETFGATLNLPLYAKGKNADKRASRTLSGIGIGFLDDCGSSMNVFVDVDSHVHSAVHKNQAPGCIYKGYNDCYYCTYCRKYFTDSTCTVEMPEDEAVIPALGHNYSFTKTVKPMADEPGYDLYTCDRCGATKKQNYKKLVGWGQDKNGNWYYAKSEDNFVTGWQTLTGRDGKTHKYYFTSNGKMLTGLRSIDGKKYYFTSSGVMYSSRLISVDGKKYYLGKDGAAYKSRLISVDGKKYYLGSDCIAYKSRLASIDGKKYYFGSDCVMYKSRLASISGQKYYFGKDGAAYKSKLISVDGKKYYIGKDCIAYKSKFASLDGKKYYFGSDCVMYKSKTFSVSGVKWKADSNGVCKKI